MGIAPYKTFTFDGESSADYGVYITGTGVFNAPERSVELIEIPNRNGAYALDKGRFENIEVTYNVGIVDDSESDFADRVAAFRNWLCSKVGYCRLEDEYNPDEYRMALFSSGVEIDHDLLIAGEAEITFNCKPQRWLKSGETAVTVADGGTIDNPTLFDASPILEVKGYGNIQFNGFDIDIENVVIGDIVIADGDTWKSGNKNYTLDTSTFNVGDEITVNYNVQFDGGLRHGEGGTLTISTQTQTDTEASFSTSPTTFTNGTRTNSLIDISSGTVTFTAGTGQTITDTSTVTVTGSGTGITSFTAKFITTTTIDYDLFTNRIIFSATFTYSSTNPKVTVLASTPQRTASIIIDSTVSALGNPTYIDCDIGECYMIKNDNIVPLNSVINLGSDLPILSSGTNTFAYDNTVTDLKVVPRWWRV